MSTRTLRAMVVFVALCLGCLASTGANAQTKVQFRIGGFLVQVDLATLRINGVPPPSGFVFSSSNARQLEGKTFAGEGNIAIRVIIDHLTGSGPSFKTNVTVKIDTSRKVNEEILNSEIWLKPLFSHNSAVKSGVRFSANMNSQTGDFHLTDLDEKPYMLRIYASPGSERSSGFAVSLKGVANSGIVLADPGRNPSSREYDFQWNGSIQFPFFSDVSPETWQGVSFDIKNLIPKPTSPLALRRDSRGKHECSFQTTDTSPHCEVADFTGQAMSVAAINVFYSPETNTFVSNEVRAYDVIPLQTEIDLRALSLTLSSYVSGMVFTSSVPNPELYVVGNDYYPDECGNGRRDVHLRRILTHWIDSKDIRDLICYDSAAICTRGQCPSCGGHYIYGTYEVRSRKCEQVGGCQEKTILSIPDAKYYPDTGQVDANGTQATLQSDELEESNPIVINIPSAQFAFSADGRFMDAVFGATLATVAESLPFEGELRFLLNNHCGYFYFQGAGSFTYFARFSGQTFVVHAPYRFFSGGSTDDPVFPGVSSILEDLRIRALSANIEEFTIAAGFAGLPPDTVITGVFTSGTAGRSLGAGIVSGSVALGPSAYLYQLQDPVGPKYKIGTFVNVRASAQVGVSQIGVGVNGYATLPSAGFVTEASKVQTLSDLKEVFKKGEFDLGGKLRLTGCASALIGHCAAGISFTAAYSSNSGFEFGSPDVCGDCGTGGCGGSGKCGN